jgi:hypothetical protein
MTRNEPMQIQGTRRCPAERSCTCASRLHDYIFRRKIGAIDQFLAEKAAWCCWKVLNTLLLSRRNRPARPNSAEQATLNAITQHITPSLNWERTAA